MATLYPVQQIINVTTVLTPIASAARNFGGTLAIGSSSVIDVNERIRSYGDLAGVASDFGTSAPEYLAAQKFFGQAPKPSLLYIGRWAQTATSGLLHGGILSAVGQTLANFTAVTAGKLTVTIDGTSKAMTALNFSGAANLNAVAAIVTTALSTAGTCVWSANNNRFDIISATTGVLSSVSFAATVSTDQAVSQIMGLRAQDGGSLVNGIASETLASCVQLLASLSTAWYFVGIAATGTGAAETDMPSVAAVVEGLTPERLAGFTTQDPNVLVPGSTTTLPYVLQATPYERSLTQYCSTSPYVVFSLFGRGATIDFSGQNTTITYKFKEEPGVTAENLTVNQYKAAAAVNCNVFTALDNGISILQEGKTAANYYIDEVQGFDWLANAIQVAQFNALFGANKIAQTDSGVNRLVTVTNRVLDQAVRNGLLAAGTWDSETVFGTLQTGQTLPQGYYTYAQPVAQQTVADRQARISPPIQVAAKSAGAIHFVNTIVQVDR
jgi:hypothetical protein